MFKMFGLNYSWLRAFSLRVFSKSKLIWIWIIFSWGILEISDDYCELHWMIKDRAPAIRAALQQSSPLAREKDPIEKLTVCKKRLFNFSTFIHVEILYKTALSHAKLSGWSVQWVSGCLTFFCLSFFSPRKKQHTLVGWFFNFHTWWDFALYHSVSS